MSVDLETRVIVLAPTLVDAQVTVRVLGEAGFGCLVCESPDQLVREVRRGAGAVLLTDEPSQREPLRELRFLLDIQPAWSELPIVLLARPDARRHEIFLRMVGVVLLERPLHTRILVSALQAALRARLRQYELRNQLEQTRAMNRELERSARAKDDFLATLSHELRNPLSALAIATNLLDRDDLGPDDAHRARQVVKRQATQMSRLLDDLPDVARITRGRLEIRKVRAGLLQIVRAAVEMVQPVLSRKHHAFELQVPEQECMIEADPVRLTQVIANLLMNAAKYTDEGGRIALQVERGADAVLIRVRDNGIGIAADAFADIFSMFSQLRPAIERSEGGLGIGLALTKGLVELHGGTISVCSDGAGRGSEFTVRVPVLPLAGMDETPAATERDRIGAACELILADDNADALDSLATVLELEGFVVRTACDGEVALSMFDQRAPAVMLLDIGMPAMNGYEVARRVRQRPAGAAVKLIALTGWGQPSDRRLANEAGFDFHFTKPVDIAALLPMLGSIARGKLSTR